jgi:CheY-like chemotaxis protein
MRAAAGEYLQADSKPSAQSLSVLADAGQLEAVLLELAAALVEGGGESANLVLSANPVRVTDLARPDQPLAPGPYVEICIVNNSEGPPNLPARMFESLLPAKDSSRESGPALVRSFRTVQEWGGTIQRVANSNEIRVYLKAAPVPQPPVPTPTDASRPAAEAAGRTVPAPAAPAKPKKPVDIEPKTRILVVEDEPGIRALMRKILEREGFEVYEAGTGAEALDMLKQKGPVNLLITDVLMPGMTGRELATEVQALDPHCGILYMSGFTADTGVETGQFPPGSFFLQKPFTLGSLLRKANEVMAATPRRRPAS